MNNGIDIYTEPLQIDEYQDALAMNGDVGIGLGVYDSNGVAIPYTGKRTVGTDRYGPFEDISEPEAVCVKYVKEDTIWIGHLRNHYGHFLTDSTDRLWVALDKEFISGKKVAYCAIEYTDYMKYVIETLGISQENLINIKDESDNQGGVRFRHLFIPQRSYLCGKYISPVFYKTFSAISDAVISGDKIEGRLYLSRSRLVKKNKTREYGEEDIERIFASNGYEVIYPEEMALEDQIKQFSRASIVVSSNGTIAHNILWCRPETKQVILQRFDEENEHQLAINKLIGNECLVIDVSDKKASHSDSIYIVTKELVDFLKNNGMRYQVPLCNRIGNCIKYHFGRLTKEAYYRIKSAR